MGSTSFKGRLEMCFVQWGTLHLESRLEIQLVSFLEIRFFLHSPFLNYFGYSFIILNPSAHSFLEVQPQMSSRGSSFAACSLLTTLQWHLSSSYRWYLLSFQLHDIMGEIQLPKFRHRVLLYGMRCLVCICPSSCAVSRSALSHANILDAIGMLCSGNQILPEGGIQLKQLDS